MEILFPELLWIEDRCYRLPPIDNNILKGNYIKDDELLEYEYNSECDTKASLEEDNVDEIDVNIETVAENRFKLSLPIAQSFWPKLIGSKGVTKKRIETDTRTRIIVPKPMEKGDVEIRGSSKRDIILAKRCIDAIIATSRQKLTYTHFISIPMISEEIKKNFEKFKESVLVQCGADRGVDESIFQNSNKLHLTITVLVLTDQSERKIAENRLRDVCNINIRPLLKSINKKIIIEMRGIEYMNDDPSEVNVLYGKVYSHPDPDILQQISNSILEYFAHHKLLKPEDNEQVKLHVTLMNTSFRKEDPEEINVEVPGSFYKKNKRAISTFNASNILEKFNNFYFGQIEIKTIELSVRFSTAENGYYKSSCSVNIYDL